MLTLLLVAALLFDPRQAPTVALTTGKVTGTIVEARTGVPLAAVLVKVQSTGQQSFSDVDGRFEIVDVPVGSQTLLVSADRTFTYRKSRLTLFVEVVNATNRDNYRANSPGVNITTRRVFEPIESLFPLLPVAGCCWSSSGLGNDSGARVGIRLTQLIRCTHPARQRP